MYLDSAYIAKYYVNEADSGAVRRVIAQAELRLTSAWAITEVTAVIHRHCREGSLTARQAQQLIDTFLTHVEQDVWTVVPVTGQLLIRTAKLVRSAPKNCFLRAGDAVHLCTAKESGEREIWTNDRHLLAAAPMFELMGRVA